MPKKNKTKAISFKKAVENTPDVAKCYQSGLQALGSYSKKIELKDTSLCSGSIDIDACTTTHYPEDNRWDYALCYNSKHPNLSIGFNLANIKLRFAAVKRGESLLWG